MVKLLRKGNLGKCILALVLVSSVFVLAGDVVVKEGLIEGEKFQSTGCIATGTKAVALGYDTEATGDYSTAMGFNTTAIGTYSTAMGHYSEASGTYSTAMGLGTMASGTYGCTAMGYGTTASVFCSTAMGLNTTASGFYSTAMGSWTIASGDVSTSMGGGTTASGNLSTAMGGGTTASGRASTAMGYETTAGPADYTTAIGTYFTNNVGSSFAVGFGQKDFAVSSGQANVYGDLEVDDKVTMGTLVLPVKTDTGDPASPVEGQIYVNTYDNKVRVYADGAWRDLATW